MLHIYSIAAGVSWAAWFHTWLLSKLTPKGVVFSCSFLSDGVCDFAAVMMSSPWSNQLVRSPKLISHSIFSAGSTVHGHYIHALTKEAQTNTQTDMQIDRRMDRRTELKQIYPFWHMLLAVCDSVTSVPTPQGISSSQSSAGDSLSQCCPEYLCVCSQDNGISSLHPGQG